jgi:hypothetical protein
VPGASTSSRLVRRKSATAFAAIAPPISSAIFARPVFVFPAGHPLSAPSADREICSQKFAFIRVHSRENHLPSLLPAFLIRPFYFSFFMLTKRLLELAGLILIGDGLMGLLRPRRHSLLWHFGPELAKAVTEELAEHPQTARAIYAGELALGIALATTQLSDVD